MDRGRGQGARRHPLVHIPLPVVSHGVTTEAHCLWTVCPGHSLGRGSSHSQSKLGLGVPLSGLLRSTEKPSSFPPKFRLWEKEKLTSAASL